MGDGPEKCNKSTPNQRGASITLRGLEAFGAYLLSIQDLYVIQLVIP